MSNSTPAFTGSGGYSTSQDFNTIKQNVSTEILQHDITNSVQVTFDVRTFNNLIGIQKDASNIEILTSDYFDSSSNAFNQDSLSISAKQFVSGINMSGNAGPNNVTSVGLYSTFYRDFANYIATYFNLPSPQGEDDDYNDQGTSQGISTLYANEYNFLPNDGIFDNDALLAVLNGDGVKDNSGSFIETLAGTIELKGITAALRFAVDTNCFGNRNIETGTTASNDGSGNTSSSNYGVSDGFYDGDVIYIAGGGTYGSVDASGNAETDGIKMTLKVIINPVYSADYAHNDSEGNAITRSVGSSLVIRLKNLSACNASVIYSSNTSNALTFSIEGTYASIIVARSLTNNDDFVVVDGGLASTGSNSTNPNTSSFTDTGLTQATTYFYTFTPVDTNGYTGVPQLKSGITLSA
jgi:hypothetical protein